MSDCFTQNSKKNRNEKYIETLDVINSRTLARRDRINEIQLIHIQKLTSQRSSKAP